MPFGPAPWTCVLSSWRVHKSERGWSKRSQLCYCTGQCTLAPQSVARWPFLPGITKMPRSSHGKGTSWTWRPCSSTQQCAEHLLTGWRVAVLLSCPRPLPSRLSVTCAHGPASGTPGRASSSVRRLSFSFAQSGFHLNSSVAKRVMCPSSHLHFPGG